MAQKVWIGPDNGLWGNADDWSPRGVPGASDQVTIDQGYCQLDDNAGAVTIASLELSHYLAIEPATSFTVTGECNIGGPSASLILLDDADADFGSLNTAGSAIDIAGGTLTVDRFVDSGTDARTTVTVEGDAQTVDPGKLVIHSTAGLGARGVVDCDVELTGHALIQFDSGSIQTISGSGTLGIAGPYAFVAVAGQTTTNSALRNLSEIDGKLYLDDTAAALAGDLTVGGSTYLSHANLNIAGDLTIDQQGQLLMESSGCNAGAYSGDGHLILRSSAAEIDTSAGLGGEGTVTGHVQLGHSSINFASGGIDTIAKGGGLYLVGNDASIGDGPHSLPDSALTGLSHIRGSLGLGQGKMLALAGGLDLAGSLFIGVRSVMSIAKALYNTGRIVAQGQRSALDVKGVTSGDGTIVLYGSAAFEGGLKGNETLDFRDDATATIRKGQRSEFSVVNFTDRNTLHLRHELVKTLNYDGAMLSLTLASGQTQHIAFSGDFGEVTFKRDGYGGTDILATPSHGH